MYRFEILEGTRVALVPLEASHIEPLFQAASNPDIWAHYPLAIHTLEDMTAFVQKALAARESNEQFPYAVYDKELQKFVGTTRYLRISLENNNLNIGSTWYNPEVWRTRVNTEAKYLMLKFAFESLRINRVEIVTLPENLRSQKAIERLGAVREGILRRKYNNRDYVFYSMIESDWPDIKKRLEAYLDE